MPETACNNGASTMARGCDDFCPAQEEIFADMHERERMAATLLQSERKFTAVFARSPAAMLISRHSDGRILDANAAYAQLTGFRHDELVGHTTVELGIVPLELRQQLLTLSQMPCYVPNVETILITKSGAPIDVLGSAELVELDDVPCVISTVIDITQRKRAEAALRDVNADLERRVAERTAELYNTVEALERANAGKDAFMAAVSHELRTPLTGILGIAETLEGGVRGPLNDDQKRYVAAIKQSGDRLLNLINGIISYTYAMGEYSPLALDRCRISDLCAVSANAASDKAEKKRQKISVRVDPIDLHILSDGQSMLQILNALLDNAVKFTPDGGEIGIEAYAVPGSEGIQIAVWDSGIGVSQEQRPYLFQPFTQVDQRLARQFDGLGLGLALVKRKAELLGGNVDVESREGVGSRFVVTLPANSL